MPPLPRALELLLSNYSYSAAGVERGACRAKEAARSPLRAAPPSTPQPIGDPPEVAAKPIRGRALVPLVVTMCLQWGLSK